MKKKKKKIDNYILSLICPHVRVRPSKKIAGLFGCFDVVYSKIEATEAFSIIFGTNLGYIYICFENENKK